MNDGVLLVNFGALQQASADIQKALSELRDAARASSRATPARWWPPGTARRRRRTRSGKRKWQTAAERPAEILRDIKLAVDESAADYQDTERQGDQPLPVMPPRGRDQSRAADPGRRRSALARYASPRASSP